MAIYTVTIPYKFYSLNEYTEANRRNPHKGANMKREMEEAITPYIDMLPVITKPITISFEWQEANMKRDPDNVAFNKKPILDTMVRLGKIRNDNMKVVKGFKDDFTVGKDYKVTLTIREVEE